MKLCRRVSLLAIALLLAAIPARAANIEISDPWIRVMPQGADVTAGYVTITNNGEKADQLIGISADGAKSADLHDMTIDDQGVMRMRPMEAGIVIEPGETIELAPGGKHLMLMGITEPFNYRSDVILTLTFIEAGEIKVPFFVGHHSRAQHDAHHSGNSSGENHSQHHKDGHSEGHADSHSHGHSE